MERRIAFLMALAFLAGCATTRVSTLWQDPEYTGGPFRKLLVIGISDRPGVRRSFEDRFAAALRARGVEAMATRRVLPDSPEPSQEALLAAARKTGADGILITRLVGTKTETVYTPPSTYMVPAYYGSWGVYYGAAWGYVHEPGYYTTYTSVLLETNLYDARTERLVWSGQSKTFDPSDVGQIVDEVPRKVAEALTEAGLLPASPKKESRHE